MAGAGADTGVGETTEGAKGTVAPGAVVAGTVTEGNEEDCWAVAALGNWLLGATGLATVDGITEGIAGIGFCLMVIVGVKGKAEKGSGRPPIPPPGGNALTGGINEGTGSAEGRVAGSGSVAVCTGDALTVGCTSVPRFVLGLQAVINPVTPIQLNIKSLFIMSYSLNHILRNSPEFPNVIPNDKHLETDWLTKFEKKNANVLVG